METYGFDLNEIIKGARENNYNEFADVIQEKVTALQKVYDVLASRHSLCPEEPIYNIDPNFLR